LSERIYRDPVHNIIRLRTDSDEGELMMRLIDAPEFQRLRRIKQLGLGLYTYQGAEHSRFTHSLGAFHLMTRVLDRLNVQSLDGYDVRGAVLGLVAEHMRPNAFLKSAAPVSDGAFRRLAQRVNLELLARFAEADCRGRGGSFDCSGSQWFLDRARSLGVEHAPPAPLVLGRHLLELGVPPGPRMGAILRAIYEKQLDGEIMSLDEGLVVARSMTG
jgi:hypothetical protein